jgi:hypothetical protein
MVTYLYGTRCRHCFNPIDILVCIANEVFMTMSDYEWQVYLNEGERLR